ncbi:MAG: cobalamin biosynthesis protein CbiD [Oscillospiraceae bacterium]|nr:cobalamin biosynthesis protein CbiD [Oscillospiraceae bacterium]
MSGNREGFTTGSCAAAAALACCLWQRDGECPDRVSIMVPGGKEYTPEIISHSDGSCGVIKDSGDDPDITRGMEVISRVEVFANDGDIIFSAGDGVGTITEPGLKIPVGEPAINPVPRSMIEAAVRSVFGARGARVTVSIPGGVEIARKTFNPRLGIKNGLSVLGTTGIVRPMSAQALRDAMYVELKMRVTQEKDPIIFTFGNQGEKAMHANFPDICIVQVSNEIGFMLDSARELGVKHLIIGGHPGKLSKIAAGVMQTHSHTADGRREAIVTQLALMGAPISLMRTVYEGVTTDVAIAAVQQAGYEKVWDGIAQAAKRYCAARVRDEIMIETVVADAAGHILGKCMEGSK